MLADSFPVKEHLLISRDHDTGYDHHDRMYSLYHLLERHFEQQTGHLLFSLKRHSLSGDDDFNSSHIIDNISSRKVLEIEIISIAFSH